MCPVGTVDGVRPSPPAETGRRCSPALVLASLLLLVGSQACSGPRLEIELVLPEGFYPRRSGLQLALRVKTTSSGEVVDCAVSPDEIGAASSVCSSTSLVAGREYVAEMRAADVPTEICANGKASGQSLPFVLDSGTTKISLFFGCEDQFGILLSLLSQPRLMHSATLVQDGAQVLIVGGAPLVAAPDKDANDPFVPSDLEPTPLVEVFDVRRLDFMHLGALELPRALHAAVAIGERGVLAVGGYGRAAGAASATPQSSIERVEGEQARLFSPLQSTRGMPSAVLLDSLQLAVVAGGNAFDANDVTAPRTAEIVDLATDGAGRAVDLVVPRRQLPLVALPGGRVLLAGGGTRPGALAEVLCVDPGACGDSQPTSHPLPFYRSTPGPMLHAAAYVPCAEGGGAVFVSGGLTDDGNGSPTTSSDAFCFRDQGATSVRLSPAGGFKLAAPRANHTATVLSGPSGDTRMLVVGGYRWEDPDGSGGNKAKMEFVPIDELITVDGCTCSAGERKALPRDHSGGAPIRSGHQATLLPDGTVLLTGGVRLTGKYLQAEGRAEVFNPAR